MEKQRKDEIDLFELLIKIYLILKKYWWVMLTAVFIAIVFAFLQSRNSNDAYESSMIISVKPDNDYMYALTFREFNKRYEKNPAEEIIGILNQTDNLIANGKLKNVAEKMNLKEEDIDGITSLSCNYKFEKGEAPGSIVSINVSSSNSDVFEKLGKGIMFLINNNRYIKDKNSADSLMLSNIINTTDLKIRELDSLQKIYYSGKSNSEFIILKDKSFFTEGVMLNSLKEKLTNDLKNLKQAKIIEDFYIPKANKKGFSKIVLIDVVLFLILSLIVIFFIVFNKKAKQYQHLKKQ